MDESIPSFFVLLLFVNIITAISSKSYYLIDIDMNVIRNGSSCPDILVNNHAYHIPNQCHKHALCSSYNCDDKLLRCIKIRETLCCLYKHIEKNCRKENLRDQFRSIYFHASIQHGYCEINLERIEQNDSSYCVGNYTETTTLSSNLSLKNFPRYQHRLTTRLSKINYLQHQTINISSKSSIIFTNFIVTFLSISFKINAQYSFLF